MSRILFLSMYPLENLDSAPKVRSYFLHKELDKIEEADLIEGTRSERSWKLLSWVLRGKFLQNKYIYVESSTSIGSPLELLFLLKAKFFGKKIFVFIRDAYPMFPKEFPEPNLKKKLLYLAWKFSIFAYKITANKFVFPTVGLAKVFDMHEKSVLLPAGADVIETRTKTSAKDNIGYVGEISKNMGYNLAIQAVEIVREKFPRTKLVIVAREAEVLGDKNSIVEWRSATYQNLEEVLSGCSICLIPRLITPYNKIALPVKLFDYMSLGKAVVSTNLPEITKIIKNEKIGLVSEDNPGDLAEKIIFLLKNKNILESSQKNSLKAIKTKHSWSIRAKSLYNIITND